MKGEFNRRMQNPRAPISRPPGCRGVCNSIWPAVRGQTPSVTSCDRREEKVLHIFQEGQAKHKPQVVRLRKATCRKNRPSLSCKTQNVASEKQWLFNQALRVPTKKAISVSVQGNELRQNYPTAASLPPRAPCASLARVGTAFSGVHCRLLVSARGRQGEVTRPGGRCYQLPPVTGTLTKSLLPPPVTVIEFPPPGPCPPLSLEAVLLPKGQELATDALPSAPLPCTCKRQPASLN